MFPNVNLCFEHVYTAIKMCIPPQFKIPRNNPGDSAAWGVTIALLTVCGGDDERT